MYYFDLKKDIEDNNRHENSSDSKNESESKTEESPSKKEESTPQKPLSAAAPKEEQPAPQKAPVTNTEKTVQFYQVTRHVVQVFVQCLTPNSQWCTVWAKERIWIWSFFNFHGSFTLVHSALNNWTKELSTD